jgi:hypothetical protein
MITLDAALDQFRSDTSTENAEMLWSVANAYKDGDMLSKKAYTAFMKKSLHLVHSTDHSTRASTEKISARIPQVIRSALPPCSFISGICAINQITYWNTAV